MQCHKDDILIFYGVLYLEHVELLCLHDLAVQYNYMY